MECAGKAMIFREMYMVERGVQDPSGGKRDRSTVHKEKEEALMNYKQL